MYGLFMDHEKFSITPEDKYQHQLLLIRSTRTNKSTTNDYKIKTKKQRKVLGKCGSKIYKKTDLQEHVLTADHLMIKTENKINKLQF